MVLFGGFFLREECVMCFQLSKQNYFVFEQQLCYKMIFVPLLRDKGRQKVEPRSVSEEEIRKITDISPE